MADRPTTAQQEIYVAIWSKAVETQMHFNEMSVKSRQFGLAFVAASLGLGIALVSRGEEFAMSVHFWGGFDIHSAVIVVCAGGFALLAVRGLDLNVYHKMLRGAVTFGEDFEENYMKEIFDLQKGMTQAISHFSRHQDAKVSVKGTKYNYSGADKKNAYEKIKRFYNLSTTVIFVTAVLLFVATGNFGHPSHQRTIPAPQSQTGPVPNTRSPALPAPQPMPAKALPAPEAAGQKPHG